MLIAIICLFTGFILGFFAAALCQEAQGCVGEADHDSGCLNPGETQSRRVYPGFRRVSDVVHERKVRAKSGKRFHPVR